jgi:hypothetical protein
VASEDPLFIKLGPTNRELFRFQGNLIVVNCCDDHSYGINKRYPGYEILTAIHVGVSHITPPLFGKGVLVKVAIGKMDVSTGSRSAKRSMRCKRRGRCNQRWNYRGAGGRSGVGLADNVGWFDPVGGDRVRFVTHQNTEGFLATGEDGVGSGIRRSLE